MLALVPLTAKYSVVTAVTEITLPNPVAASETGFTMEAKICCGRKVPNMDKRIFLLSSGKRRGSVVLIRINAGMAAIMNLKARADARMASTEFLKPSAIA
ncbi:hypothetical protein SDC9_80914 [bioreactor metagenome]|uniref:Uncharacterized protein n=1 Tax=bioreactor metagenome TaxID=1076179 RepID=A0A644Z0S8_9ZZZZ